MYLSAGQAQLAQAPLQQRALQYMNYARWVLSANMLKRISCPAPLRSFISCMTNAICPLRWRGCLACILNIN